MNKVNAPIGVLMLDTQFKRMPGDVGHPPSWPHPAIFRVVKGADPVRVVQGGAEGLLEPFIETAKSLIAEGCAAITTSCGFLAIFQKELAAALPVPVFTSALLQAPQIEATLPAGKRVGILTFSAESLTERHLKGVGAALDTPIGGVDPGSLFRAYYGNRPAVYDFDQLNADILAAVANLRSAHPEVGAILCECTNMPPHSRAIAEATGLPVYDFMTLAGWIAQAIKPRIYDAVPA